MSEPMLQLDRVRAAYGRVDVLRDVDLVVPAGRTVALIGPNGAGKTTLLRLAAGLMRPTAGSVRLAGRDVTGMAPHRRAASGLCLVPEGRGIFRQLTVRENLRLQIPRTAADRVPEDAFEVFPALADRADDRAGSLSGGQQQMLALSRCFLADPRIVLLDEVSMGLAPLVVREIFAALPKLSARGMAVLLVEQYVGRALELADDVYLLNQGSVSFHGPPTALDENELMRRYMGLAEQR